MNTRELIEHECDAVKAMLLAKNAAYGNSALEPVRVFSKASPVEQILVRLDDKLSRLARGRAAGEDVVQDLIGYLILLRVAEKAVADAPEPLASNTLRVDATGAKMPHTFVEWEHCGSRNAEGFFCTIPRGFPHDHHEATAPGTDEIYAKWPNKPDRVVKRGRMYLSYAEGGFAHWSRYQNKAVRYRHSEALMVIAGLDSIRASRCKVVRLRSKHI